jgi:hypothetical protein
MFFVKEKRQDGFEEAREHFLSAITGIPIMEPYRYYFDLDSIRVPHKTQSLERYQRGVNQQAWGKPYKGKFSGIENRVQERGGMQASALRRGISVNPPAWFEENMSPDSEYKGNFDNMCRHHGSGPQNKLTGLNRQGSKANNLDLRVSHQNRNFMSYKPRHFELLFEEDKEAGY